MNMIPPWENHDDEISVTRPFGRLRIVRAFWLSLAAVVVSAVVIVVVTARNTDAPVDQAALAAADSPAPTTLSFGVEGSADEAPRDAEPTKSSAETPITPLDLPTRVLFIGNSYTLSNDLPTTVGIIAQANDVTLDIGMNAHRGFSLETHLARSHAAGILRNQDWDKVVIQELSTFPADPAAFVASTKPAVAAFVANAQGVGTDVVFFETWGHRDGNEEIGQPGYGPMQQAVIESYEELAKLHSADLARVGEAWADTLAGNPEIELYVDDGSHPTPAGSYLAALVIARTLAGKPLDFAPAVGVTAETANTLLKHANAAAPS